MKRTKRINRSRIMREIWMKREVSRIDIARALHLDKSTVSHNVNELLDLGIIRETSEGDSGPQGGRKPINITLNTSYGCVLGIELRPDNYTAVAVALDGEILYSRYERHTICGDCLEEQCLALIAGLREEVKARDLKLLGIGIGMSGVIDSKTGTIKYSIPLDIESEYEFYNRVAEKIDVPLFIDNDANTCVWGELAFHRRQELRDCLFLLLEFRDSTPEFQGEPCDLISLGVGLLINGNVHYGHDYSAGEFRSVFRTEKSLGQFSLTADEQSQIEGDEAVRGRFLRELGINMSLLVNTFNLTHIILGGDFERYGAEVVRVLEDEIRKNWPYPYTYKEKKHIWFSSFGDKAVSYGAAGMVLNKLFSDLEILEDYSGHLDVQSRAGII